MGNIPTQNLGPPREKANYRRLQELRERYRLFSYDSFAVSNDGNDLKVTFSFSIHPNRQHTSGDPVLRFEPTLVFNNVGSGWRSLDIDNLVFHLGLAEMFSYWKATCSPIIAIRAGQLSTQQAGWWKDLLLHGMGEFFYVNRIDFTEEDFVSIEAEQSDTVSQVLNARGEEYLVPIGGGRDSAFTAESLRQAGLPFRSMLLNPTQSALRVSATAGCLNPIVIERTIDPLLLELNKRGFLNGHTPFSAYLAFLSALCLPLYSGSTVVISNERSSDEASVNYLSREVNHQYSKSLRFEGLFDDYLRANLLSDARYVSFVRSLYELQIGRAFAKMPKYFTLFRSCNRNQKLDSWCGSCAKCLSVFITLYPFVTHEQIISIFGRDLFKLDTTLVILRQLAGLEGAKPLECVCTKREVAASLHLCVQKLQSQSLTLPCGLVRAEAEILQDVQYARDLAADILNARGPDRLPSQLKELLEAILANVAQ